jgi:hypothetical protein
MPRRKRLEADAEQIAIYLTPTEQLVMNVISVRRKKKEENRTSPSEIVADALWKILIEVEGVSRTAIEDLLRVHKETDQGGCNVKLFPKKT